MKEIDKDSVISQKYKVCCELGGGGQGAVYKVKSLTTNEFFAMKLYNPTFSTNLQEVKIKKLINDMKSNRFILPIEIAHYDGKLGYTMPLIPEGYRSINNLLNRNPDPSFKVLFSLCYNVVKAFRELHLDGYCYGDVSPANIFFDPQNGDVIICDVDNIVVNHERISILGTPRFMAPEIARGESTPTADSDLYSIAVLLFNMLMLHHPMSGKRCSNIINRPFEDEDERRIFGTEPLFIWNPADDSNRPVLGEEQNNAIIYWNLYPQFLKNLFIRSFTDGINNPNHRIRDIEWLSAMLALDDSIVFCPTCGRENVIDIINIKRGVKPICWEKTCQKVIPLPMALVIDNKKTVLLYEDTEIFEHHIMRFNFEKNLVGKVVHHPEKKDIAGICNCTDNEWVYIKPDGDKQKIAKGKSAIIAKDARIDFGNAIGKFTILM